MFYKHLHDPSCDLFMHGEEAPQSKEAQLQAALDAEREKVAAYDKWLSGGVYFTTEEYKDLVANHNQQLATLQAQLAGLKRNAGLDCGDQSCLYAVEHTGMRTNGGCRCDPKRMKDDLVRSRKACDALQARCAHLDVLLRDEYLPKLDVVAVQRSIADRDSRIDALEREVEKLDDDKETLQAQVKQLDRTLADVYQQRDGLQAQLRQVEGERDEWERKCRDLCQAHGVLLIEHHDVKKDLTTLRQLVEALPVVDAQEVSVWLSPDESGWLVSKRPAFPAGLYWAKFRTQAEADSFRSLLAYRATLVAQDAGKEDVSHD